MATGLVILTIAFADSLVAALRGELPPYADRELRRRLDDDRSRRRRRLSGRGGDWPSQDTHG